MLKKFTNNRISKDNLMSLTGIDSWNFLEKIPKKGPILVKKIKHKVF